METTKGLTVTIELCTFVDAEDFDATRDKMLLLKEQMEEMLEKICDDIQNELDLSVDNFDVSVEV